MNSLFIVFEGIGGSGKTTQSQALYHHFKHTYPVREIIWTREPGGSEIAEEIRTLVQGTDFDEEMHPVCEAYLYASSRAQTLRTVVKPVLDNNGIVVLDNSFFTGLTYKGFARELGPDLYFKINDVATADIFQPDAVIYLDIDIKPSLQRTFDWDGDKFERQDESFFEKVKDGYYQISQMPQFKDIWYNIDARGTIEEVEGRVLETLKPIIEQSN